MVRGRRQRKRSRRRKDESPWGSPGSSICGDHLNLIVAQPFGRLVVALVAVGLCGYMLRRFVQVLVEPAEGVPPKPVVRIIRRVGFALSGLAHVGIALAALRLVLGLAVLSSGGPPASRGWATLLFVWKPLDGWLTLLAGLVIIGVAIFYFYKAVSRRFTMDLELERMSRRVERATLACGIAGYAGRGVGFLIMGATGLSSRVERFLLGSVSAAVAARAHCSVEVVRVPE